MPPFGRYAGFFHFVGVMESIFRFLVAAFFCTVVSGTAHPAESRGETAALAGAVVTADGIPVRGAVVALSPGAYADTTDAAGRFRIGDVPPGRYELGVRAPFEGFGDVRMVVRLPRDAAAPVRIVLRERTYRADEVVVVSPGGRGTGAGGDGPSFVTVIERKEFEGKAVTVADVIAATPGANVSAMGGLGSFTEVSLRGARSNQVRVYLDGMLLNEAVGGPVNLGTIPLANVESVEVWRSGAPPHLGGDAIGGAINIRTRDIGRPLKTFSAGYGSFDTFTANGVMSFPHEAGRFLLNVDFSSSKNDFEYESDNGTARNPDDDYRARRCNDEYRAANLLAKYNRLLRNGVLLEFSEILLASRKNLPNSQHIRYSSAFLTTTKNLFRARAIWHPGGMRRVSFAPALHHILNHEHYVDRKGDVGWGEQDNIYDTDAFEFILPVTLEAFGNTVLTVTPSARRESYRPEHRLDRTIPLSCDRRRFGVVCDAAVRSPEGRFALTVKMRRDRYYSTYEGEANPFMPVPPDPALHWFTNVEAGLKLVPARWLSLRGNYGDIRREPSFYELFGDRGTTLSKPGLRPERVFRRDAGVRFDTAGSRLPFAGTFECVYFENRYRDVIQWYSNNYGFMEPCNVPRSYVKGTELVWNLRFPGRFSVSGNWTFQDSRVTYTEKVYHRGKKLPNRPDGYGNVSVTVPWGKFVFFWSIDRKGAYFLDRANQEHKRYPGRTLHDAGFRLSFPGGKVSFTLILKNLTDVHTFDIQGMPKPGRSFMATVDYSL